MQGENDEPGRKLFAASPAIPRSVLTRPLLVSSTWVSVESGMLEYLLTWIYRSIECKLRTVFLYLRVDCHSLRSILQDYIHAPSLPKGTIICHEHHENPSIRWFINMFNMSSYRSSIHKLQPGSASLMRVVSLANKVLQACWLHAYLQRPVAVARIFTNTSWVLVGFAIQCSLLSQLNHLLGRFEVSTRCIWFPLAICTSMA